MLKAIIKAKINSDFEKFVIDRINKMADERTPIATVAKTHYKLYLMATELNGFNYLAFTLVCPVEFKTINGCTFTFKSDSDEFVLKSESDIIESDYTKKSDIGITLVDADFDEEFDAFVKANTITEIRIDCRVGQVIKKNVSMTYSDVDMESFKESMIPKAAEGTGNISTPGSNNTGLGI